MHTLYLILAIGFLSGIAFRLSNKLELLLFGIYFICMIICFVGFVIQGEGYFIGFTGTFIAITLFKMRQSWNRFKD